MRPTTQSENPGAFARAEQMAAIREIRDEDLPPQFQSGNFYTTGHDMVSAFRAYCAANRIFYYARPKEDFFVGEAYELAAKAGAKYILLEDLS